MAINDPLGDLLTRIRNAQMRRKDKVSTPGSKLRAHVLDVLKEEGYIRAYKCVRDDKQGILKIALKYSDDGEGAITGLHRKSRPGRRLYVHSDKIPFVKNGFGFNIISTSKGLMTDRQARKDKVGGEYICSVY